MKTIQTEATQAETMQTETNNPTYEQWGTLVPERQGKRSDLDKLVELVEDGANDDEIRFLMPSHYMRYKTSIQRLRQEVIEARYKDVFRILDVSYIWGKPNTNKTKTVLERYGYENVCHITQYKNPMNFDRYVRSEDVICFDEFMSQIPIYSMNPILDGYPLMLPCRFSDRVACYTKAYIISNVCLLEQYKDVQKNTPDVFLAFVRRINRLINFLPDGTQKEYEPLKYVQTKGKSPNALTPTSGSKKTVSNKLAAVAANSKFITQEIKSLILSPSVEFDGTPNEFLEAVIILRKKGYRVKSYQFPQVNAAQKNRSAIIVFDSEAAPTMHQPPIFHMAHMEENNAVVFYRQFSRSASIFSTQLKSSAKDFLKWADSLPYFRNLG
jgi:hypothetical protein